MTFSREMVHILPGYPKQSPNDPEDAMLAFYLSLPEGLSKTTVVNKDVLMDIVKSDKASIGGSLNSTIVSVDPVPSSSQKLEDGNKNNENESKPAVAIIGASVGGVLFIVLIAVLFVGCKRSNRYLHFIGS